MGDNTEVMNGITRLPGVSYPVLTPNLRVRALASCQPRGGRVAVVLCVGSLTLAGLWACVSAQGLESALECGVEEVAVFAAASDAFSQKNINCSVMDSFERFKPVLAAAKDAGVRVRGYVQLCS